LVETLGSDSVNIALTQDDVVAVADLDLVTILGVEEDLVADLHAPDVGTGSFDLRPGQTPRHLSSRGDEDASGGSALAVFGGSANQDAIVEHLDGELLDRSSAVRATPLPVRPR